MPYGIIWENLPNDHQIYIKDPKLEPIIEFNVENITEDSSVLVIDPLKVEENSIACLSLNRKKPLDSLPRNNVSQENKKLQKNSKKNPSVKKGNYYQCKNEEYICDTCEIVFWDFEKITNHKIQDHGYKEGEIVYDCANCYRSFSQIILFLKHIKSISKKQQRSKKKKDNNETGKCKCDLCGELFSNAQYLKLHFKVIHKGCENYKCDFCDLKFSFKGSLRRHVQIIHEGNKNYKCESCEKSFSDAEL